MSPAAVEVKFDGQKHIRTYENALRVLYVACSALQLYSDVESQLMRLTRVITRRAYPTHEADSSGQTWL